MRFLERNVSLGEAPSLPSLPVMTVSYLRQEEEIPAEKAPDAVAAPPDPVPAAPETVPAAPPPPREEEAGSKEKKGDGVANAEEPYFLLKDLTKEPRIVQDTSISTVIWVAEGGAREIPVRLYIDSAGKVSRIETDDEALPAGGRAFLEQRFRDIRFRPGRIGDKPVNSILESTVNIMVDPSMAAASKKTEGEQLPP